MWYLETSRSSENSSLLVTLAVMLLSYLSSLWRQLRVTFSPSVNVLVDDHSKKKRKERKLTCRLATHFHTFHFYITTKQNVCVSPPFYDKNLKNNLLLMRPPTLSVFQPLPLKIMNTEPHSHSCARPSEEAPPLSSWANGARTPLIILIPGWPMGASNTGSHDAFLCAPCSLSAQSQRVQASLKTWHRRNRTFAVLGGTHQVLCYANFTAIRWRCHIPSTRMTPGFVGGAHLAVSKTQSHRGKTITPRSYRNEL